MSLQPQVPTLHPTSISVDNAAPDESLTQALTFAETLDDASASIASQDKALSAMPTDEPLKQPGANTLPADANVAPAPILEPLPSGKTLPAAGERLPAALPLQDAGSQTQAAPAEQGLPTPAQTGSEYRATPEPAYQAAHEAVKPRFDSGSTQLASPHSGGEVERVSPIQRSLLTARVEAGYSQAGYFAAGYAAAGASAAERSGAPQQAQAPNERHLVQIQLPQMPAVPMRAADQQPEAETAGAASATKSDLPPALPAGAVKLPKVSVGAVIVPGEATQMLAKTGELTVPIQGPAIDSTNGPGITKSADPGPAVIAINEAPATPGAPMHAAANQPTQSAVTNPVDAPAADLKAPTVVPQHLSASDVQTDDSLRSRRETQIDLARARMRSYNALLANSANAETRVSNERRISYEGRISSDMQTTSHTAAQALRITEMAVAAPDGRTGSEGVERALLAPLRVEQSSADLARLSTPGLPSTTESGARELSSAVQDQVLRAMTRNALAQGRLTVQLSPRELGAVDIEFSSERGELQVAIVTREAATRDLLDGALPRLRQSLQDAGLSVGNLDVRQDDQRQQTLADDRLPQQRGRNDDGNARHDLAEGNGEAPAHHAGDGRLHVYV